MPYKIHITGQEINLGGWEIVCLKSVYRKMPNYWIASGEKVGVYRGTLHSRRSVLGPNRCLKEQLSFCRHYLSSLVFVDLMGSSKCEIEIQIVAIKYYRNSIITGPTVCMYLFTTLPRPHEHWQLRELLGNQCAYVLKVSSWNRYVLTIVGRERQNRKKTRPAYVRDPKRTRTRT